MKYPWYFRIWTILLLLFMSSLLNHYTIISIFLLCISIALIYKRIKFRHVYKDILASQDENCETEYSYEPLEYDELYQKYLDMQNDEEFMQMHREYFRNHEKIEHQYSIIYNLNSFTPVSTVGLIALCRRQIELYKNLLPKWRKYYGHDYCPYINAYKRMSMIYEKQGNYLNAANICVESINNGIINDGTTSGMIGRLARMIRRGNLEPTDEMKQILLEYMSE